MRVGVGVPSVSGPVIVPAAAIVSAHGGEDPDQQEGADDAANDNSGNGTSGETVTGAAAA